MQMAYCTNCGKKMGFKRSFGVGTVLMILLTFGLWILILPFYQPRCIGCGSTFLSAAASRLDQAMLAWRDKEHQIKGQPYQSDEKSVSPW